MHVKAQDNITNTHAHKRIFYICMTLYGQYNTC